MATSGNPNSISDAGVGSLCTHTAIHGAYMNVLINCKDFGDEAYVSKIRRKAGAIIKKADKENNRIIKLVMKEII